jgi:hypothetical protein
MVSRVSGGETGAEQAAGVLGSYVAGLMKAQIDSGGYIPNAPATVRRKKSGQPLIDTGHMRQSIRAVIRRKGSGEA